MAKLSARGRKEIVRLVKSLPDTEMATNRKRYFVLMSDRRVLTKVTYNMDLGLGGRSHESTKWTVQGKLKLDWTPDQFTEDAISRGWKKVE